MKKTALFLLIFLLAMAGGVALANSAPTHWEGVPGWEMLAVDEDCPIEVASERLTFDLRDMDSEGRGGRVEAVYEMVNPTDEDIRVEMAFPLISSISGFDLSYPGLSGAQISVDGAAADFQVYYGAEVEPGETPDIETILAALGEQPAIALPEMGKLYTYQVQAEERMDFAIHLTLGESSWAIGKNFNSYQTEAGGQVRIAAYCDPRWEQEEISLFILGDMPELTIVGYESGGDWDTETDAFTYQEEEQEISLREYLSGNINWDQAANDQIHQARLDRVATELADYLADNHFCLDFVLSGISQGQRAALLTYAVDFPAGGRREVAVSYGATAEADGNSAPFWQYNVDYLLNPAQHWADFQDLRITVLAPEHSPYIVTSTVGLSQTEPGIWEADLAELPEEDLSFTLYSQEQITDWDIFTKKVSDFFRSVTYMLVFFWWIILPILALVIFFIVRGIVRRKRKQWREDNYHREERNQ